MKEILISVGPALLAFIGAIIKSKYDLKKQELQHDAKLAEIRTEAAEKREEANRRFEERIKEIKAETDEELRKADAELERKFLENFTDRKSTRLNSSHVAISYAVFCLKKKTKNRNPPTLT